MVYECADITLPLHIWNACTYTHIPQEKKGGGGGAQTEQINLFSKGYILGTQSGEEGTDGWLVRYKMIQDLFPLGWKRSTIVKLWWLFSYFIIDHKNLSSMHRSVHQHSKDKHSWPVSNRQKWLDCSPPCSLLPVPCNLWQCWDCVHSGQSRSSSRGQEQCRGNSHGPGSEDRRWKHCESSQQAAGWGSL